MNELLSLIEKIHASPHKAVLAVAGAGTQAVALLLSVSGASRSLLEVVIPYGRMSMVDLLGEEPAQYVCSETAVAMARACFNRANNLLDDTSPVIGLACTATIATDRTKLGDHRGCIAAWTASGVYQFDLVLNKGARDRLGEEMVLSKAVINMLAQVSGIDSQIDIGSDAHETPKIAYFSHSDPIDRLLSGDVDKVMVNPNGDMTPTFDVPQCIYPGSFRPLHAGHKLLSEVAHNHSGYPVVFEISVENVDKPPLTKDEIIDRLAQFRGYSSVVLTRAETFYKKALLFPGTTFILGWDTAVRLVDPKYYSDDIDFMFSKLCEMSASGTKFLVAGREKNGVFQSVSDVDIPKGFERLFGGISEDQFRVDISSTELRNKDGGIS